MRRKHGICGLCGTEAEVTREHFVPQGLWSGALPIRTETAPACDQCNAGSNLDDEYFRNTLAMMFDQSHPQKQAVFAGPVTRSFQKHPAWIDYARKNVTVRPLMTAAGIWLGDFPTLPLDIDRFTRSLRKIVKGLFFLIRKHPFPTDGQIGIIGELSPETKPLIEMIEENLTPIFDFGDDVFEWQFSQTTDGMTMWKLAFYRTVVFYAVGMENAEDWEALHKSVEAPR